MFPVVIIFVVVMMLVFSTSCDNRPKKISAELGDVAELKIGETVSIEDDEITFKFVEVLSDSRCPTGATCVWQGEITCTLEITYLDESYTKTITHPGLTDPFSADTFQEYEINYNFKPYPELDKEIKADEYRLYLVINRNQ